MQHPDLTPTGTWEPGPVPPAFGSRELLLAIPRVRQPLHVLREAPGGRLGVGVGGSVGPGDSDGQGGRYPLLGTLPALYPEWLGDRAFLERHGVRFPYVAGAMANGIASPELVLAMAEAGMLAFFGAAGLPLDQVERGLDQIQDRLGDGDQRPWGSNLIYSPGEPALEQALAELYIRRGIRRVSASAYMRLTPAVVRYACSGLRPDPAGGVRRRHRLLAKVSRPEVARLFMAPPPAELLRSLVDSGQLTSQEAELAARVPLAGDITAEGDSGGHTDNRPLAALLPALRALADQIAARQGYRHPLRVGAAGGLGTPAAVASAFAQGAAYVLTGSINQSAVEARLSGAAKQMLSRAELADVSMAPSPDMFELGARVQVLKRETLFAARAAQLRRIYSAHDSLEQVPAEQRQRLEREIFCAPLEQIWQQTREYFQGRDPRQVQRAEQDPRHRMALVFRWYLGQSSRWAIDGDPQRVVDYQIWCGPAMGAFNGWVAGSFLQQPEQRTVVQIARNLLEGAAVVTRAQQLRSFGVAVPPAAFDFQPRPLR